MSKYPKNYNPKVVRADPPPRDKTKSPVHPDLLAQLSKVQKENLGKRRENRREARKENRQESRKQKEK